MSDAIAKAALSAGQLVLPENAPNRAQIAKTAQEFESVFLSQMLQPMFDGMKTDGLFGGGFAEEVYRGLMLENIGREMAATGGIGLSDEVVAAMVRMQGDAK
jgi:Rod binding domain-containing protein